MNKIYKRILMGFGLFILLLCLVSCGNKTGDDKKVDDEQKDDPVVVEESVKVTFDIEGVTSSITVKKGELITFPENPTKEGYTFYGWKNNDSYFSVDTAVTSDLYLVASFMVNSYTLTVDYDNGETETIKLNYGEKIELKTPTKTGYTFSKWDKELETMPASDTTIKALYTINNYKVTIKYNDGVTEDSVLTVEYLGKINVINPSRDGYIFDGWSTEIPEAITEDITLEAKWTSIKYRLVIMNYYGEGENYATSIGATEAINLMEPSMEGALFKEYNEKEDGTGKKIDLDTMPFHDVTIYVIWTYEVYTITYYLNEGTSDAPLKENYTRKDAEIILPSCSKDGYRFDGWVMIEGEKETPITKIDTLSAKNYSLKATYTKIRYNLSYFLNDGIFETEAPSNFITNNGILDLQTPVKEGYFFKGWYLEEDFKTKIDAIDTSIPIDYKLYACWALMMDLPTLVDKTYVYNTETQALEFSSKQDESYYTITGDLSATNVGIYTITITPTQGNVWTNGTDNVEKLIWEIKPWEIEFNWENTTVSYNGEYQKPTVKGTSINQTKEFAFELTDGYTNVGSYEVSVKTINGETTFENYSITNPVTSFTIEKVAITEVNMNKNTFVYNGKTQIPTVTEVKAGDKVLSFEEYNIGVLMTIDAGNYKVIVEGLGNYDGTIEKDYTITKAASPFSLTQSIVTIEAGNTFDFTSILKDAKGTITYPDFKSLLDGNVNYTFEGSKLTIAGIISEDQSFTHSDYVINDSGDNNYEAGSQTFTLTVSRKIVNLTAVSEFTIKVGETLPLSTLNINKGDNNAKVSVSVFEGTDYLKYENETFTGLKYDNGDIVKIAVIVGQTSIYAGAALMINANVEKGDGLKKIDVTYNQETKQLEVTPTASSSSLTFTYLWQGCFATSLAKATLSTTDKLTLPQLRLKLELSVTVYLTDTENYNTVSLTKTFSVKEATPDVTDVLTFVGQTVPLTFSYNYQNLNIVGISEPSSFKASSISGSTVNFTMPSTATTSTVDYNLVASNNGTLSIYYATVNYDIHGDSDNYVEATDNKITRITLNTDVYLPTHLNGVRITAIECSITYTDASSTHIVYLPKSIQSVTNGSFSNGLTLGYIYYMGTKEEFDATYSNYASWGLSSVSSTSTIVCHIYCLDITATYVDSGYQFYCYEVSCLIKGTPVLLADGSTKMIEDINYDDLLMVADLINGGYTYEYPLWIEKASMVNSYTRVSFSDGTIINIKASHSLFNSDTLKFVDNGSELKEGIHVYKFDYTTKSYYSVQVTKIEEISEEVQVYHVFSTSMFNIIAADLVTAWYGEVLNNFYSYDSNLKMNETERAISLKDVYTEEEISVLPHYLYVGFRAGETKRAVDMGIADYDGWIYYLSTNPGNADLYQSMETVTINGEEKRVFNVCTTCDFVTQKVLEGDTFTLTEAAVLEGKTFIGYRNSVDNKIYYAGDKVTIECSTCFIAIYE